jgi:Sec-independent protein translocase protein TatA
MDFLGVGPFELLLILIISIIFLGPERLQQAARSIGRLLAQVMAWQSQSPEAQMIQQIRADFEQEIVELRNEMIRARKQMDLAAEAQQIHQDLTSSFSVPGLLQQPSGVATSSPEKRKQRALHEANNHTSAAVAPPHSSSAPPVPGRTELANGEHTSNPPPATDDQLLQQLLATPAEAHQPGTAAPAITLQRLAQRVEALSAELHALQEHLHQHGMLNAVPRSPPTARPPEPAAAGSHQQHDTHAQ